MRSVVALAALFGASGCLLVTPPNGHMGGGDGAVANDSGLAPVSATAACGEIALVACQGYIECCDTATATMNQCVTALQTSCDSSLGPIFRAPEAGYDPAIAAEVLAEGRSYFAGGRCGTELVAWYHSRMGLQRALRGTISAGMQCALMGNSAAASVSCNDITYGCIGDDAAGYYCSARHAMGLTCHSDADCVAEDYCEGFTPGSTPPFGLGGHCQPRRPIGAACTDDTACSTYLCDTMTTHVCTALNQHNAYCGLH
jgi:hypothetical protein